MKEKGCLCRVRPKKGPKLGKPYHVTDNKLDRDFQADKPMEKLVTDITYLYFGNCRLYLSSIMDLYNREIVAYSISECQDTDFVLDTLHQLELPQGALLHSDQGSVYTSKAYYQACTEKGITRSMSRKGTPADNACIEWFHSILKSETFYLHNWRNLTKDSITDIVKNYIIFYNETRIQQRLNDQSPVGTENWSHKRVFLLSHYWGAVPEFLLVFRFLSELRSQNFASFTTTSCQYATTVFSCHTVTETMFARTTKFTWLISTFHDEYLLIDFVFV